MSHQIPKAFESTQQSLYSFCRRLNSGQESEANMFEWTKQLSNYLLLLSSFLI